MDPVDDSPSVFDDDPLIYTRLPENLRRGREVGRIDDFDNEAYDPGVGWPKRIFVLEFSPGEETP